MRATWVIVTISGGACAISKPASAEPISSPPNRKRRTFATGRRRYFPSSCVRKHLSFLKGGASRRWRTRQPSSALLAFPDVIGDLWTSSDLDHAPDPTTFAEAIPGPRKMQVSRALRKSCSSCCDKERAANRGHDPARRPLFKTSTTSSPAARTRAKRPLRQARARRLSAAHSIERSLGRGARSSAHARRNPA